MVYFQSVKLYASYWGLCFSKKFCHLNLTKNIICSNPYKSKKKKKLDA